MINTLQREHARCSTNPFSSLGAATVTKIRNLLATAILSAVAFTIVGCHRNDPPKPAAAPQAPAAAKVNGAEISVQQVEGILAKASGVTPENTDRAKAEILDKLIDQQLAVEQALTKKLDTTPTVMQALEAARREVLSRAYLEQVAAAQPKPTAEEARKFYEEHPELFAQRRLYNIQEIAIPGAGPVGDEVTQLVAKGKSMQDIANALKAKKIPFRANAGASAAEQIPLELLQKFHTMKDGETTVIQGSQGILVARVASSKPQPVDETTALPRIEQFIANQRNLEAVAKDIRALREKAKIEKIGDFAKADPAPALPPAPGTTPAAIDGGREPATTR
jgi:EpsD family peptidyl-prolyl cis-trans isomerase